jgi:hypothetical protein
VENPLFNLLGNSGGHHAPVHLCPQWKKELSLFGLLEKSRPISHLDRLIG